MDVCPFFEENKIGTQISDAIGVKKDATGLLNAVFFLTWGASFCDNLL